MNDCGAASAIASVCSVLDLSSRGPVGVSHYSIAYQRSFPQSDNLPVKICPALAAARRIFTGKLSAGETFSGERSYNGAPSPSPDSWYSASINVDIVTRRGIDSPTRPAPISAVTSIRSAEFMRLPCRVYHIAVSYTALYK